MDNVSLYQQDGQVKNIKITRGDQATLRKNINIFLFKRRYRYILAFWIIGVLFVYTFLVLKSFISYFIFKN